MSKIYNFAHYKAKRDATNKAAKQRQVALAVALMPKTNFPKYFGGDK
jgi:hypothetical protein